MRTGCVAGLSVVAMLLAVMGCSKPREEQGEQKVQETVGEVTMLKVYPLDSMAGIITQPDDLVKLEIDPQVSADGNGSLMIEVDKPSTIRLYEVGDLDIEDARLIYRAKLRTEFVEGRVYLQMWCHFPEAGDFYSTGLASSLTGTTEWVTVETPFLLEEGQNPDNIRLNLVFDGSGTAWIDEIRLIKGPRQ